jgi:hypothetical protein
MGHKIKLIVNSKIQTVNFIDWTGPLHVGDIIFIAPYHFGIRVTNLQHTMGIISDHSSTEQYTYVHLKTEVPDFTEQVMKSGQWQEYP